MIQVLGFRQRFVATPRGSLFVYLLLVVVQVRLEVSPGHDSDCYMFVSLYVCSTSTINDAISDIELEIQELEELAHEKI